MQRFYSKHCNTKILICFIFKAVLIEKRCSVWHKITNILLFFYKIVILGFYAGKSHNLIGLGIFHGDLDFFYLHEKFLGLSNYEIFPHKIIKSRTFKKSSILIVNMDPCRDQQGFCSTHFTSINEARIQQYNKM